MKKVLSLILAMAMIMSTLVVLTIMPAVAAEPVLQPAKTYTLDSSNWLEDDNFMLGYSDGSFHNFVYPWTNLDTIPETTFNGEALLAGEKTLYKVVDDKLHAYPTGNDSSEGIKPVIVFTAPSYGSYSYSVTLNLEDGKGAAAMNSYRTSWRFNECGVTVSSANTSATTSFTELESDNQTPTGNTSISLNAGQKVLFTIHDTNNSTCDVSFTITVTFNGSEGKAFNFVSNGTDSHGTFFGLYGTATQGVDSLTELKIKYVEGSTTDKVTVGINGSITGTAGTGYFMADGTETAWAADQGGKLVIPTAMGRYDNEVTKNSAVVVKFTAPADGTYSLNVNGQLWGGIDVPVQLYGDNGYIRSASLPSAITATDFGKVTLVKGESVYFRFAGNGAGYTISGISATYVASAETDVGYTASILPAEQQTIGYNANVNVKLNVNKATDATITNFAAAEFKLTYDKTYFEFNADASELGTAQYKIVEGENNINTIIVEDYGATKSFGDAYTLAFKGLVATEGADPATVSINLIKAAFSRAVDAVKDDLTAATLVNTEVNVQINKERFTVTLDPADHFSTSGEAIKGESFTITEKNVANYDYNDVVITMNGVTLTEDDYTYANNQYVIDEVTGPITVTATVTEKEYDVTITGKTESNDGNKATYNTDYKFTIPENVEVGDTTDGYTYTVHNLTIGGTAIIVDGVVQDGMAGRYSVEDRTYTIGGSYITGAITVEVKEEVTSANSVTVGYEGQTGAISTKPTQATKNTAFSVTLDNPTPGYNYTVTYTVGGTDKGELTAVEGVYTIPAGDVTAPIVITVTATVKTDVEVKEYLTLDGATMYLVLNKVDELTNDTNYSIWGSTIAGVKAMFWSDKYNAYCYLVVVEGEAPVASDFTLNIVNGAATVVHEKDGEGNEIALVKYDVNMTDVIDANDAQLVYNMYETKAYTGFDANATVEKFLRADVNDTVGVNVDDARAVIAYVVANVQ